MLSAQESSKFCVLEENMGLSEENAELINEKAEVRREEVEAVAETASTAVFKIAKDELNSTREEFDFLRREVVEFEFLKRENEELLTV